MFTLMKNTITSGNFKFIDLQQRIAKLYAMGNLSEDELDELLAMAAEKASPDTERPELLQLILSLFAKVEALTSRVKALEGGETADGIEESDTADYPEWEPWDGLSQNYLIDTIVVHNGQLWKSTHSGQNVWEPGVVDERFWVRC